MIFGLLLSTYNTLREDSCKWENHSGVFIYDDARCSRCAHNVQNMQIKKPFDSNHLKFRTLLFQIQLKIFPQRVLSLVYTCRKKSLTIPTKYIKYMQYAYTLYIHTCFS